MPYRIAVTDYTFPDLQIERAILEPLGIEIVHDQCKNPDQVAKLCADCDAVITQFASVNSAAIKGMSKAKAIVRYGIGFDNVDIAAARDCNIPVCNIPDYCIHEVADHTLAFILALTRQVVPNHLYIQNRKWGLATPLVNMRALSDLSIGVIGLGRIGREVVARLAPFGCKRLVFDPVVPSAEIEKLGASPVSLENLFAQSDIITLHCPSNQATRGMINASTIAKMKEGVSIVNLARGDLVDTQALIDALQTSRISGAALDVFNPEPLPADSVLRSLPNVVVASHIASTSPKAVHKLRSSAAQIAADAVFGKPLHSIVNGVVPR